MTPIEEFEAQGVLQPGEPGWWKVWGASVQDVRAGDIVITRTGTFHVEALFEAKSVARQGIVVNGQPQTIGRMFGPIVVVRKGTHNTLAGSVR